MGDSLDITVEKLRRCTLVTLHGRIDSETYADFDNTLSGLVDHGSYKLVVDLSSVSYINSGGIRALVSAMKDCRRQSGDLRLSRLSSGVKDLLDDADLIPVFTIFLDTTQAIGSF